MKQTAKYISSKAFAHHILLWTWIIHCHVIVLLGGGYNPLCIYNITSIGKLVWKISWFKSAAEHLKCVIAKNKKIEAFMTYYICQKIIERSLGFSELWEYDNVHRLVYFTCV